MHFSSPTDLEKLTAQCKERVFLGEGARHCSISPLPGLSFPTSSIITLCAARLQVLDENHLSSVPETLHISTISSRGTGGASRGCAQRGENKRA